MALWRATQAKAQSSEVIAKAMTEGPQEVAKGGKDAVMVVSKAEWEKQSRHYRSAAEFVWNRRCGKARPYAVELADILLAATAHAHGLAVVTLTRRHSERLGVVLVKF